MTGSGQRNASSSVRRALRLLVAVRDLQDQHHSVSLGQLAEVLNVEKSSVSRLAGPLVEEGLLVKDDQAHLRLGRANLELGHAYLDGLHLPEVAKPYLQELMEQTKETCHLAVRDGVDAFYVVKLVNPEVAVRLQSRLGRRVSMHSSAVGKAITAYAEPAVLEHVLASPRVAKSPATITDPDEFRREIARTRRRGYAIDDGEDQPEIRCVATAILDDENVVIGALSVTGIAARMPHRRLRRIGPVVARVGLEISRQMGSPRARALLRD